MEFEARCFGPLVSARFEPVGDFTSIFARELQAGGSIRSAVDENGLAHTIYLSDSVVHSATGATLPGGVEREL